MASFKAQKNLIYLSHRRGLFIGHVPPKMRSCQASPVFVVNLQGHFRVNLDGNEFLAKTLLLKAGMEIECTSDDPLIANFILDRIECDYERIRAQMEQQINGIHFGFRDEERVINVLKKIYATECEIYEALKLLTEYFDAVTPRVEEISLDPRIVKIVNYICDQPFENLSLEEMAKLANLSIPRLVDLFKHEMDVPIRKFRTWKRFFAACQAISENHSITEAAHMAGFTDSSHFNKSFKDMFGANPKDIFRPETQIIVKAK